MCPSAMPRISALLPALVLMCLLVVPSVASAGTLSREGFVLVYTAAPGEANAVVLDDEGTEGYRVLISDPGHLDTVSLPSGCVAAGASVRCDPMNGVTVRLGDGDDTVTSPSATMIYGVTVVGGDGDDTLSGGGPRSRTFDGGPGTDHVSYASRGFGLSIRPDLGQVVTRYSGPYFQDTLSGVERYTGTDFGDTFHGAPGATWIDAGDGPDEVYVTDGAGDDVVDCGPGVDRAFGDDADAFGACENLTRPMDVPPVIPAPSPGVWTSYISPPTGPGAMPRAYVAPTAVALTRTPTLVLSDANMGSSSVGFLAEPTVEDGALVAHVQGPDGATVALRWTVTPWRGGETVALDPATGQIPKGKEVEMDADSRSSKSGGVDQNRPGAWVDNSVLVRAPLPPALRARLARDGHFRLGVELTATAVSGQTAAGSAKLVGASLPAPPAVGGGRVYKGDFGKQRVAGTSRGDTLAGKSGDDLLRGLGGNDHLDGGTGNDRLEGGPGTDWSDGFDGDDMHFGGAGDDYLVESRFGDDILDGGAGDDVLDGGRGNDTLKGGAGDDVIWGGSGPDKIDCGEGEDIAFINFEYERRSITGCEHVLLEGYVPTRDCKASDDRATDNAELLLGTEGHDACRGRGGDDDLEGRGGNDRLNGDGGHDRIFGRKGDDQLRGGAGNDELEGGRGKDLLDGGPGRDQLNGGLDNDRLWGGSGADTIIARGGGRDTIDCGIGRDTVYVDSGDRWTNCEIVRRK
jgi:hypothetical protein